MTSSTITAVNHNEPMDPPHPRADGPRRRRAFTEFTLDKPALTAAA